MAFCSNCGAALDDNARFCPKCGTPTGGSAINRGQSSVPSFTPPADGGSQAPTFTPPTSGIPTFTPPTSSIPTFTPPTSGAPIFTPPTSRNYGAVCFHHPNEPAAAQCARCGKYICKDCVEAYSVSAGEYAGQCLCFDCCEELVASNVEELTKNKKKIKAQFILSLVGMGIGFILGIIVGIEDKAGFFTCLLTGIIFGLIGAMFLSTIKATLSITWESIKAGFESGFIAGLIAFFVGMFILIIRIIFLSIKRTIYFIRYLKETSGFIESDSAALQQMRDYMEYTLVRSNNKGVDLETLMNEDSQLYNNSYAQSVLNNGEAAADATLREATTRIAENGEIIRSFAA